MIQYDLPLTTNVVTGYPSFAKPFAGKKPHVMFINSVKFGREIAELVQIADMTWANVTFDQHWDLNKWGFGDFYDKRGDINNNTIIVQNLEEMLTSEQHFDVIVVPSINGWNEFSPKTRQAILRRVEEGAGLVLLHPMYGEKPKSGEEATELSLLSPLLDDNAQKPYSDEWFSSMFSKPWQAHGHFITKGIAFDLLPFASLVCSPYRAEGDVILSTEEGYPVAAVRQVKKGRVAAFAYYSRDILPQHADYRGQDGCFNPVIDTWRGAVLPTDFNFMEIFHRLIARSIYWSAGADAISQIENAVYQNGKITVKTDGTGKLRASIWNLYDECIFPEQEVESEFSLPEACSMGGTFRVEMILLETGSVCDFYTLVVEQPAQVHVESVTLSNDVLKNGDCLTAEVMYSGKECTLIAGLVDDYGRLLEETRMEAKPGKHSFSFILKDILSIHVKVAVKAEIDGKEAARGKSSPCIVTPSERGLSDFEVFMNPQNRGQGDLLHYVNELFPKMGLTGSFTGDNRLTAMSGSHGLGVYWYNRAPYVKNKEQYLRSGDKAFLVRKPCLNDEAFWQENQQNIEKTVGANRKYGPIAYFAQDEGSLTCYSDEFDFCFCDKCMTKMQGWLKTQYPSLEALNREWETAYPDWDEAVPLTRQEAKKSGIWASWADHRRFMELTYTDAYRHMRDLIQTYDPEGRVRMSGCQASTAYSGNDYDLLHQYVRYFEAYPAGGQYEFHRSFKHPETILGGWFGYGADGANVQHNIWHALLHGLTLISIFWEYSCLNPDFTFSRSALDMGKTFAEIRQEGIGKLLLYAAKADTLDVAVHYSMASVHGTNINGRKIFFEENRGAWLELLEDLGIQYRFVSTRQIEEGELSNGIKLLILPYSVAIGSAEALKIEAFVKAGGIVLGDAQTGIMDEHCKMQSFGALDHLFGIERLNTDHEAYFINAEYVPNPEFTYFDISSVSSEAGPEVTTAEPGIRVTTGMRGFCDTFSGNIASLIVNSFGKGYGIYLNFTAQEYSQQRRSGGGEGLCKILSEIMSFAKIVKPASVFDRAGKTLLKGIESFYYTAAGAQVVCLLKRLGHTQLKYDGLSKNQAAGQLSSEEITAVFPQQTHIYDVRKKKYLGFHQEIQDEIIDGDVNIYALVPYKAKKMRLQHAELADETQVKAILEVDGQVLERAVFAVNIHEPDGKYSFLYSKNYITQKNEVGFSIRFAINDAPGNWRVQVKDVLTGVASEIIICR